MLVEIGDKIISADLFKKKFVCDLVACKGACCVEGDAGAPLTAGEVAAISSQLDEIRPFMNKEGADAVSVHGVSTLDKDGEAVTTLVENRACAFAFFKEGNTALCAIEAAYRAGKIENLKPISCALYPIRVKKFNEFTAIQYDEWSICSAACAQGERLGIPVYRFLKESIIRAFGVDFFNELTHIEKEIANIDE